MVCEGGSTSLILHPTWSDQLSKPEALWIDSANEIPNCDNLCNVTLPQLQIYVLNLFAFNQDIRMIELHIYQNRKEEINVYIFLCKKL